MKFEEMELDDRLLAACLEAGYEKPTNVQAEVIPEALNGMDILADAPTGTGKTAAFLLPCLQHLIDFPAARNGLARVLILTPTRELALQISEHATRLVKYLPNIKIGTIIGGVQHEEQLPIISEKTDVVIATPGRLIEYLRKKAFDIRSVEILVLDEADRMLDMGFIDDVAEISEAAERREQTMLFSATLEGALLERFANEVLQKPVEIHVDSPRSERRKIVQYKYYADDLEHKIKILEALLTDERFQKNIVFVKTRERLAELVRRLDADGFKFCYLRGEMEQERRTQAMQRFANGEVNIMLATDVAARGIDVADITHVINFDLPRTADIYVHRIGRTARAGKRGCAVSLIEAHDVPMLDRIEHYTGESIDVRVVDELRPQNKVADFSKKKNKTENREDKSEQQHRKERSRDKKNKGRPDFAAKLKAKLEKSGATPEEIAKVMAAHEHQEQDAKKTKRAEKVAERKQKAEATANVLAEISARRGRDVVPPEKVQASQVAFKSANGKNNPPEIIIEDDGEDYYDDDDIEMIEERKLNNAKKPVSSSRKKEKQFGHSFSRRRGKEASWDEDSDFGSDNGEEETSGRYGRGLRFFDDGFGRDENYRDFGESERRSEPRRGHGVYGRSRCDDAQNDEHRSFRKERRDNSHSFKKDGWHKEGSCDRSSREAKSYRNERGDRDDHRSRQDKSVRHGTGFSGNKPQSERNSYAQKRTDGRRADGKRDEGSRGGRGRSVGFGRSSSRRRDDR